MRTFENEDELLVRFQSGDETAFNQFYSKLYPALCFFATRLLSDKPVAEEIVQDVLFTFWKKKDDFFSFKPAKTFLYVSVRNACMNHLDKENRKAKKQFHIATQTVEQPFLHEIVLAEVLNELKQEVAKLPEQCAKVIQMLYEEEMKPQQIADELKITVSTVYNQKLRGINLLRKRVAVSSLDLMSMLLLLKSLE